MKKRVVSVMLVVVMVFAMAFCFAGCSNGTDGKDGVTPQLRIDAETNFWEVSYDEGETWTSLEVKATGPAGKDGVDGKDGKDGKDGIDGKDGVNGVDGVNGTNGSDGKDGVDGADGVSAAAPQLRINAETNYWEVSYDSGATWTSLDVKATGADGADGKDGVDGVDGTNGTNGTNGTTPTIGEDGYWYIGETNTGIYAGTSEQVTVTFKEISGDYTVTITAKSKVNYYVPKSAALTFEGWYADEACTEPFNFNEAITEDTTVYSKWGGYDAEAVFEKVGALTQSVNFGRASCTGTANCFGSVYVRVLADDHGYYGGAAGIANYLKGVFVEDADGNVTVSTSSALRRISYTDALTVINFSSALSSYQEYILRNGMTMPDDIAAQKALAIKFFETVDYTADGYNTHTGGGMTFPSMAVAVVAMGNLMEQQNTERYDTLIKAAYENVDAAFWNAAMYLDPFYQLCAKYEWFDKSKLPAVGDSLSTANVLSYYAYGIDLANDYPAQWNAFVESALSDNVLSASEAKAFAYHYAYELTGGDVYLGVYGNSRAVVDYAAG